MQGANDSASELEYKPFGPVRFVCEISDLLRLPLRGSCGWPINMGRFRVSSVARRARFVWLALTVTGDIVNADGAVTDTPPRITGFSPTGVVSDTTPTHPTRKPRDHEEVTFRVQ